MPHYMLFSSGHWAVNTTWLTKSLLSRYLKSRGRRRQANTQQGSKTEWQTGEGKEDTTWFVVIRKSLYWGDNTGAKIQMMRSPQVKVSDSSGQRIRTRAKTTKEKQSQHVQRSYFKRPHYYSQYSRQYQRTVSFVLGMIMALWVYDNFHHCQAYLCICVCIYIHTYICIVQ